jgi:hypothetical protein
LYQIAHILEATGIIHRSLVPGQLTIVDRFFVPIELKKLQEEPNRRSPYAIGSILNHSDPRDEIVYQKRKGEFSAESTRQGPGRQ